MSFLDRFKSQPRWKHADAAVRARGGRRAAHRRPGAAAGARSSWPARRGHPGPAGRPGAHRRRRGSRRGSSRSERDEDAPARTHRSPGRRRRIAPAPGDGDAALALGGLDDREAARDGGEELAARNRARPPRSGASRIRKCLGQRRAARRRRADGARRRRPRHRIRPSSSTSRSRRTTRTPGIAALERDRDTARLRARAATRSSWCPTRAKNKSVAKRARAMLQGIDEAEAARARGARTMAAADRRRAGAREALAAAPVGGGHARYSSRRRGDWLALVEHRQLRGGSGDGRPFRCRRRRGARPPSSGLERELAEQRAAAERRASAARRAARRSASRSRRVSARTRSKRSTGRARNGRGWPRSR